MIYEVLNYSSKKPKVGLKNVAQLFFFFFFFLTNFEVFTKWDETLFGVFDIASQIAFDVRRRHPNRMKFLRLREHPL